MRVHAAFPVLLFSLTAVACQHGNGIPATRAYDVAGAHALEQRTLLDVTITRGPKAQLALTCDENLLGAFRVRVEGTRLILDTKGPSLDPKVDCTGDLELPNLRFVENEGSGQVSVLDDFESLEVIRVRGSGGFEGLGAARGVEELTVRGSGSARLSALEGTLLRVSSRGSGSIDIGRLDATESVELTSRGSGSVRMGGLNTPRLFAHLEGSGSTDVVGAVEMTDVFLRGSGSFRAQSLSSQDADLRGEGSGEIWLTVARTLRLRLSGSGDALVWGPPDREDVHTSGSGRYRRR